MESFRAEAEEGSETEDDDDDDEDQDDFFSSVVHSDACRKHPLSDSTPQSIKTDISRKSDL